MEIVAPVQESHFESTTTTPYMSAPSSPKHLDEEFAFDFSGQLEKNAPPPVLTSADELFDQGRIRPLKPFHFPASAFSPTISHSLPQDMTPTPPIANISRKGSWKWRVKNFLLFRSLSEGQITRDRSQDFVKKFAALSSPSSPKVRKEGGVDGSRSSSFRSVDSNESVRSPNARPCRPSFFSCICFSPAIRGVASRG